MPRPLFSRERMLPQCIYLECTSTLNHQLKKRKKGLLRIYLEHEDKSLPPSLCLSLFLNGLREENNLKKTAGSLNF